jgi:hypothetical protein
MASPVTRRAERLGSSKLVVLRIAQPAEVDDDAIVWSERSIRKRIESASKMRI